MIIVELKNGWNKGRQQPNLNCLCNEQLPALGTGMDSNKLPPVWETHYPFAGRSSPHNKDINALKYVNQNEYNHVRLKTGILPMERAGSKTLEVLIAAPERPHRPTAVLRGQSLFGGRARTSPPRHCKCGTCYHCVENARWERIFVEKFADPDYYSRRGIRHASALFEIEQLGTGRSSK